MRKHRAESIGTLKGPALFVNGTRVAGTQPKNMGNVFHIFEIDEVQLNTAVGRHAIGTGFAGKIWIDHQWVWLNENGGYGDRLSRFIWPGKWEVEEMLEKWSNHNPKIVRVTLYKRDKGK